MPLHPKYPVYNEPRGVCGTCGNPVPVSKLILTKRFGWQCERDYDGPVQRDELHPVFRPYEGSRLTPAPVVDPDEGVEDDDAWNVFTLRDRATGTLYDVTFGASITVAASAKSTGYDAISLAGGWYFYVTNGAYATAHYAESGKVIPWSNVADLHVDSAGTLQYTAYA